jgi:tetratricopeptide (TPR) repeat protein
MKRGTCVACAEEHPLGTMFFTRGGPHCQVCVDLLLKDPHVPIRPSELRPLVDPTICARCRADGPEDLQKLGEFNLCAACMHRVRRPPIPPAAWASWALLAALAALAGSRFLRWTEASRTLARAEAHFADGRCSAARELAAGLPESTRTARLLVRLRLAEDRVGEARNLAGLHGVEMRELEDAESGVAQAAEAASALHRGELEEAMARIGRARKLYPLSLQIQYGYLHIAGAHAFSRGKFEEYIEAHVILGEARPDDVDAMLDHAAALAARWALKGEGRDRDAARSLLERARAAAAADPGVAERVREFAGFVEERIRTGKLVEFRRP